MTRANSSRKSLVDADEIVRNRPEILIVDADPSNRTALKNLILPLANVLECENGDQAVHIGATHELAGILIDIELPGCDGMQTIMRLRDVSQARNVPVLFLSPEAPDFLTERRGYELGALGYLRKPVEPTALLAKLEVLLTLHRRGVELRQMTAHAHAKDIYMGVLGHDLRTPLSAIMMSARLVLMRGTLTPADRESITRIARNGERMSALIRDILDYTRGQAAGGIRILPKPTHMGDICSAIVEELALLHRDRVIRMAKTGDLSGTWDRERVEQVVSNLLSNAIAHGTGDIRIAVDDAGDHVTLSVHNRGTPIPPNLIPTIFEPFSRGSTNELGLGLGLYIVSEILRSHGGTVGVTSTIDGGTLFTTRWPRQTPRGTSA
jgi:signal transduction histidine kinase